MKKKRLQVAVTTRHRKIRIPHQKVSRVVKKAAGELLPARSVMSVAFLGDREMTSVNESYTGRKGTTDVLSFPLGENEITGAVHHEILISLDRAKRQAKSKSVSLIQEVIRLLIHAVVHLAGYDHHDPKMFKEMRRVEFGLLMECL